MNSLLGKILCFSILYFSFSACSLESTVEKAENADLQILLESGFVRESIVELQDAFLIENDIVIEKKNIKPALTKENNNYVGYSHIVDIQRFPEILIYLDPQLSGWSSALNLAISDYNSIGSGIKFKRATSAPYHCYIALGSPYGCGIAEADFSANGEPGRSAVIASQYVNLDINYRKGVFIHELGHIIGLTHSNSSGLAVPLTQSPTENSAILNASCGNALLAIRNSLTSEDVKAIKILYTNPTLNLTSPVANSVFDCNGSISIKWTASGTISYSKAVLFYSKDNGPFNPIPSASGLNYNVGGVGEFTWINPGVDLISNNIRIKIEDENWFLRDQKGMSVVSQSFTIKAPTLSVSISGPSSLAKGQIGTWTASSSNAIAPVFYFWYKSYDDINYSGPFLSAPSYTSSNTNVWLKVVAVTAYQSGEAKKYVSFGGPIFED